MAERDDIRLTEVSPRTTIYMGPWTLDAKRREKSLSTHVERAVSRYRYLIDKGLPWQVNQEERAIIQNLVRRENHMRMASHSLMNNLASEIRLYRRKSTSGRQQVYITLADRIEAMSAGELVALLDYCNV